ncbi:unnamed protein product [Rhizoctonia solani]|uniref:Uncharacterized protein n=1 Tax=Rhizoctonia solani TaxID=456999 RepID=A0A8H2WJ35_9AGAM|nr:unnamed protein product [Rhizoctonia solani]
MNAPCGGLSNSVTNPELQLSYRLYLRRPSLPSGVDKTKASGRLCSFDHHSTMGKPCYTVCQAQGHTDHSNTALSLQLRELPRSSARTCATSLTPFSPPRLYDLARTSQTDASSNPSRTGSIARGLGPARPQSTDEPAPVQLRSQPEQATHTEDEHTHEINSGPEVTPLLRQSSTPAVTNPDASSVTEPVLESHREKPNDNNLARVKVLLCGDPGDYYSAADIKRFNKDCRKFIGHGVRTMEGVDVRMGIPPEKITGTFDLHSEINKIQVPCTLEIVFATCTSEAIISGLDRLLVMEVSDAHNGPQDPLPLSSVLFKALFSHRVPKLSTKAIVIVWAAAVDEGPAYEEESLPGRERKHDIMIGAICRALEAAGQTIPRRTLFEKIRETVVEHNVARDKRHFSRTEPEQRQAWRTGRYRGSQCERILDGPAFQAVGNAETVQLKAGNT